jgi:predicted Rossmann-fold nucleotide-binding protein
MCQYSWRSDRVRPRTGYLPHVRTELTTVDALRAHRAAGRDLRRAVLVGLDLTAPEDDALLRGTALDEALLLGCRLVPSTMQRAEASAALLFPEIPALPYRAYRSTLYTPAELFGGFDPSTPESYVDTLDCVVYQHVRSVGAERPDPLHALAERLHDHSITEALDDALDAARLAGRAAPVAVMGGHALARDSDGYRAGAELGRALGRSPAGFTVLTGGGPGAMEAVPLGARLAGFPDDALPAALAVLATAPRFATDHGAVSDATAGRWLAAALEALAAYPVTGDGPPRSIGIPTWFYGHEPPNVFCDAHAKYFANSVREDGLLTVASGGVVYTPGSAGTVQEVFADYAQNHYGSVGPAAPMIFLGTRFWTQDVPAAQLVRRLATGRGIEDLILVTDRVDEAVGLLESYARRQVLADQGPQLGAVGQQG